MEVVGTFFKHQGEAIMPARNGSRESAARGAREGASSHEPVLHVKVICTELPGIAFRDAQDQHSPLREPVYLGLQRGREVIDRVPADRDQATFDLTFRVGSKADGSPNFLGPFAQGPPTDRFFYLTWDVRTPAGTFHMFRRLKVRLGHLGWPEIRRSIETDTPLVVRLRMTDRKGAPLCATPPPSHIAWDVT